MPKGTRRHDAIPDSADFVPVGCAATGRPPGDSQKRTQRRPGRELEALEFRLARSANQCSLTTPIWFQPGRDHVVNLRREETASDVRQYLDLPHRSSHLGRANERELASYVQSSSRNSSCNLAVSATNGDASAAVDVERVNFGASFGEHALVGLPANSAPKKSLIKSHKNQT